MLTERRWSTADVCSSQVFDYWKETVQHILPGLMVETLTKDFAAEMRQGKVGGFDVSLVKAAPQCVRSTPRPRSETDGEFALIYLRKGALKVRQFARSLELTAGQCVLLDGREQSEVVTCATSESLNLVLPANWLRQWLVRPEHEVARPFTAEYERARPFLATLNLLAGPSSHDVDGDMLFNHLGGALAIAVGKQDVEGTPHAGRLLNRIRQVIWRRAGESDFRPQSAADEIGISRRYLVSLFQSAGTTFNTELMRVRLERGAEMLRDCRFQPLSVMEISIRCGFSDASHFSKRFKERFGMPPAAYRDGQLSGGVSTAFEDTLH